MNEPRYFITVVSVGEAGLTQRPAVVDRKTGRVVHTYRKNERHLAEKMADKLNENDRG